MKENILKEFRKEYNKNLKEKEGNDKHLKILIERKTILENSPLVKDYIDLNRQIQEVLDKVCTEEDVFLTTLYDYENQGLTDETNNIYLYLGSFINENGYDREVEKDSLVAEFDRYIDIESFDNIDIPVEDRDLFVSENKVLVLDNDVPLKYLLYELHEQFIKDSLINGQEDACKKILSKNKKNY